MRHIGYISDNKIIYNFNKVADILNKLLFDENIEEQYRSRKWHIIFEVVKIISTANYNILHTFFLEKTKSIQNECNNINFSKDKAKFLEKVGKLKTFSRNYRIVWNSIMKNSMKEDESNHMINSFVTFWKNK